MGGRRRFLSWVCSSSLLDEITSASSTNVAAPSATRLLPLEGGSVTSSASTPSAGTSRYRRSSSSSILGPWSVLHGTRVNGRPAKPELLEVEGWVSPLVEASHSFTTSPVLEPTTSPVTSASSVLSTSASGGATAFSVALGSVAACRSRFPGRRLWRRLDAALWPMVHLAKLITCSWRKGPWGGGSDRCGISGHSEMHLQSQKAYNSTLEAQLRKQIRNCWDSTEKATTSGST